MINIGDALGMMTRFAGQAGDLALHAAPGATKILGAKRQGRLEADAAADELERRNREEEAAADRQEQERLERASRMEYLRAQRIALEKETNAPPKPVLLEGTGGRTFPDTPEGREAYAEWERTHNPSKYRAPEPDEVNWDTRETADGTLVQVHPRTGVVREIPDVRVSRPDRSDPRSEERRRGLIARHGAPTNEVEQDVLDALVEGGSRETIIAEMRAQGVPAHIINRAADYITPPQR